jgi:hypothetical protein
MSLRIKSTIVLLRRCVNGCCNVNELIDELEGMIFTMTLVRCDRRYFVRTLVSTIVVTVRVVGGKEPSNETTIRWLPLLRYRL